ncbi:MAG: septum formation initiator family protein [Candidatus Falkowbacteria bacterium]|nr:septum formation initiator family protein [Candidatus Falkowbacteria bacterium]
MSKQALLTGIALTIIVLISFPLARNVSKQYKINKEISDLKNEISSLENNNFKLKDLIKYAESAEFVDEEARLKLNYKKEGEQVVGIENKVDNTNAGANGGEQTSNASTADSNQQKENNLVKWERYFFNK